MHSEFQVLDPAALQDSDRPATAWSIDDAGAPVSGYLWRPYLDLSPFEQGPSDVSSVECAYRQFADDSHPLLQIQFHPAPSTRFALVHELGLPGYAVRVLEDLPQRLRTDRWRHAAERAAAAERGALPSAGAQLRLATLLNTLGLYYDTVRLFRDRIASDDGDPERTVLGIRCAMAVNRIEGTAESRRLNIEVLGRVAENPRESLHVRISAVITLIVLFAKGPTRELERVRHWRAVGERLYWRLKPEEGLPDVLDASAFWRAASYLPFLLGDSRTTAAELRVAEQHAAAFEPEDDTEQMLWGQNMHPLLESSARAAFEAGDLERATGFVDRLVSLDPFSAKAHLYAASLRLAAGDPESALPSCLHAVQLGAPFTSSAWLMTGRCREELGDDESARNAYVEAIRTDPGAVDARRRLVRLATRTGSEAEFVTEWAWESLRAILDRRGERPGAAVNEGTR